MVSASWVFLDEHFKLRSNYKTLFEQQIEPAVKKYQDIIIAFYSQDEPYMNGLEHTPQVSIEEMNTQLETMGSFMKSKFPQIPIAVIFATKALYDPALLKKIVLPPSHDWFGMDCYDSFLWCGKKSIPQGYDIIKDLMTKATNLDGKKRWLMAVPPSGHPMRDSTFTLHDEDGVLSQLSDYKKFVASEPLFKVVIPFIWQSFNEWKGTRDLPRAKAEYQKFFQEFTN
ncbi:MAG: hypothetical protein IPM57_12535 [Oligoflexia bacterium]|nr:hypothetical protein [Oligoflexia bacterium]